MAEEEAGEGVETGAGDITGSDTGADEGEVGMADDSPPPSSEDVAAILSAMVPLGASVALAVSSNLPIAAVEGVAGDFSMLLSFTGDASTVSSDGHAR